jgi:hypothetical protein
MTCPVCSLPSDRGVSLSTGKVVHEGCFSELTRSLSDAEHTLHMLKNQQAALSAQLERQASLWGALLRLFDGSPDSEQLRRRLAATAESLRAADTHRANLLAKALPIFDTMLNYPPDWASRSAAVSKRDGVCTACGSGRVLQAHHVIPLSKGGTNRLSNLRLLCERCHQQEHGAKDFKRTRAKDQLAIADRVQTLQSAITMNCDVEFLYRKPAETSHRKRVVTPKSLIEVEHHRDDGQTLCLTGYCHTRKAERVFALKRMRGVKFTRISPRG